MRCDCCGWKYPSSLLSPLFIGGQGYTEPVCAICALDLSNKALGVARTALTGEMAESMRQAALLWRKRHPADKPVLM
jgi:hypothetical protein